MSGEFKHPVEMIRQILVDLIDGRTGHAARLDASQWRDLAVMARQHRLEPLLHSHHDSLAGVVPESLLASWSAAHRHAAMRSLQIQRTLILIDRALAAADIPYVALKGAWLAWHGYAHPALRPMRDVDILVPPDQLVDAFRALEQSGFSQRSVGVPIEHALAHDKHLPPLMCRDTGVPVEIHRRITDYAGTVGTATRFDDPARILARSRRMAVGGHGIAFPDPSDSLLHLIIHAVVDHRFNNGPQILPDVEAALRSSINWPEFWSMAAGGGWEKACQLVLALARWHRHTMPDVPVAPTPDNGLPDQAVLDCCTQLMLATGTEGERTMMSIGLAGSIAGVGKARRVDRIAALVRRVVPAPHVLATFAGQPSGSRNVWRHYPAWALDRLRRMGETLQPQVQRDVQRHHRVGAWLFGERP